jgi:phosphate transport system protein
MTAEARGEFHRELDRLDISITSLLALVPEAVMTASTALLVSDEPGAERLDRWRVIVDEMYVDIEHTIEVVVARQSPVAGDLRFLLACIRLVPWLHEVMDLISDVAAPSHRAIGEHLTPRVISLIEQLAERTSSAWEAVESGWRSRSPRVERTVRERLELAADVRSAVAAELGSGSLSLPVALEMAVTTRAFDRLGHHARQSARLVVSLAPREPVEGLA